MKTLMSFTTAVAFSTIKRSIIAASLALGILVLVEQVNAQGTGSSFTEQEKAEYLGVHNDARREVGSPPAEWDTTLASEAQQFANFLASADLFKHASEFPEWKREMGENLAYNFEANPAKKAAEQWLAERAAFQRLNTNGKLLAAHVNNYDIFKDIGHYTQMVWQDTTKVGGGKAQYATGPNKGAWIVVGKYSPGGNYQDKYAYGTPNNSPPANNAGPGGGAPAPMNPAQGPDKSTYTQGDAKVTIKVTNNSGQPVAYEWVDYEGKPAPQAPMSATGVTLFCYPGHLYRFHVGGTATPYRATRDAVQNYTIGSPANNPGPIGGAQATPPSAATQNKSIHKQGSEKLDLYVTNKTGQTLILFWVDGEGTEAQTPTTVPPDAENFKIGFSYPGHLFRFKIGKQLVHSWVIQEDQPHLTIESPAAAGMSVAELKKEVAALHYVDLGDVKMKMTLIPKGDFWMGGGDGKAGTKQEKVGEFYMGLYEVTQAQWKGVMGADKNPSKFKGDDLPVETVSWNDAKKFIDTLNQKKKGSGYVYRLPTEVEWEYACRGAANSQEENAFNFYFDQPTNDLSSDQANFNGDQPAGKAAKSKSLGTTVKVGSYKPNKLGLYDMHGNVWEWTDTLGSSGRVLRGGHWNDRGQNCRAAYLLTNAPEGLNENLGFRLAASKSP